MFYAIRTIKIFEDISMVIYDDDIKLRKAAMLHI